MYCCSPNCPLFLKEESTQEKKKQKNMRNKSVKTQWVSMNCVE